MEKTRDPNADKQCRFCRYFESINNVQAGITMNLCRKLPPTSAAMVIGAVPGQDGKPQPIWSYTTQWPAVNSTDWCGDFMRRIESVK